VRLLEVCCEECDGTGVVVTDDDACDDCPTCGGEGWL
jgi:hypothetical protein